MAPGERYVHKTNARGIGTVRYPRLVACDADAAKELKKRTLTNLYNQRPLGSTSRTGGWTRRYSQRIGGIRAFRMRFCWGTCWN